MEPYLDSPNVVLTDVDMKNVDFVRRLFNVRLL